MRRRSVSISLALLLAVLSLHVPPVQAQTPTPTYGPSPTPRSYIGYFWLGEQLISPIAMTTTYPTAAASNTVRCSTYGGYVAAALAVYEGIGGAIYGGIGWYSPSGANLMTPYRFSAQAGRMVYIVINNYHAIPDEILSTVITAYSSTTAGSEVYVDVIDIPPSAYVLLRHALLTATSGNVIGYNILCHVPPTPTFTATPADILRATTTSGAQYNLERTVTYGDMAVSIAVLGLIVVILLALFLWSPRLRL